MSSPSGAPPPPEPKKRKTNKQKRSLSKQGSSALHHHGPAEHGVLDPAQFAGTAEFSPVTPPDTPGTLVNYTTLSTAPKSSVTLADPKSKSLPHSYVQTWSTTSSITSHLSAAKSVISHGASGQLSSLGLPHGSLVTLPQEWAHSSVYSLNAYQLASKSMLKTDSNTAATSSSKITGAPIPTGTTPQGLTQQLASPQQPLHFNIQSLVYRAASYPGKTDAAQLASANRDGKQQPAGELRSTKNNPGLISEAQSGFVSPEIKKEFSPQIKVTSPQLNSGFTSPIFNPGLPYTHLSGAHVSALSPSQFRPQGIGAAGFAAPGKVSTTHASANAHVSIASLYPHIHSSSPHVNTQNMLSGKQQLMLSALSMGNQRKVVSSADSPPSDSSKTSASKSSTSVLRSPSSLASPKQLSIVIPPPSASRHKSDAGSEERSPAPESSRKSSADFRSNDGSFSPLTPTDIGLRDIVAAKTAGAPGEIVGQGLSLINVPPKHRTTLDTEPVSKVPSYAAAVQKSADAINVVDSATDSAPEAEQGAHSQESNKLSGNSPMKIQTNQEQKPKRALEAADATAASVAAPDVAKSNPPSHPSEEPNSPEDLELVIDEDAKVSEEAPPTTSINQSPQKVESLPKEADIKSPDSHASTEPEDKNTNNTLPSSSQTASTGTEPVAWPKTKKQLARQQLSKTHGE